MNDTYQPDQKLTYFFNIKKKTLYVNSLVEVTIGDTDSMLEESHTDMDKESNISWKVDIGSNNTSVKKATKTVSIKLFDAPTASGPDTKIILNRLIEDDLRRKNINSYKVITKIVNKTNVELKQQSSTISANGTIEIE